MFIDATPNSELIKKFREVEERCKIDDKKRIKFVEKSGMKLIDAIRPSNQFQSNCKDEECIACKDSKKLSNCRKSNVGYTIQCSTCKNKGINKVYEGESCRNLHHRQKEHMNQLKKKKENSVLYKHIQTDHKNEEPEGINFKITMAGSYTHPLRRILNEGVRISHREENELMNSKKEFFGPAVSRKIIV